MAVWKARKMLIISLCAGLLLSISAAAQEDSSGQDQAEEGPRTLRIWWPEAMTSGNEAAISLRTRQAEEFASSEGDLVVEFRLKKVGEEAGSLMPTLRTASTVAPGALPDLTLMRRLDLVNAQRSGLIQSMEGLVSAAVIGDLGSALSLGQVDGELFGIPYLLEVQHLIYHPQDNVEYAAWRFEDVLNREEALVFPAARTSGISDIFYLQYLDAGGSFPRDGAPILNENALLTALTFYEAAYKSELINANVLEFAQAQDYLESMLNGFVSLAQVNSTMYQQLRSEDASLEAAPLPTASGRATTILDGWVWVVVASNPDQQSLATRYLNWIMQEDQQSGFARSVSMLPSQRSVLQSSIRDANYAALVNTLLSNAVLPLTESEGGTLARALQEAFSAVLRGEQTAEQAAQSVIEKLEQ